MAQTHGLERIREAVLAQADREVEEITTRTDREITRIEQESARTVQRIMDEAKESAGAESQANQLRTQSMARLDERRVQLTARQNLISETVTEALARLKDADAETKMDIYQRLLPSKVGAGTVATAAAGERSILERAIDAAGLSDQITVAEEGTFSGGFLLRQGPITDNMSFDQLFALKADELRQAAAEVLFRKPTEDQA